MDPDRAKTQAHELLQRFHGPKYISSTDFNSAFLQIPLEESSRIWTAFNFDSKIYQFTWVPFGIRNFFVLLGLCSLFSDRILQDMFSTTWILIYIEIPMKNTSTPGCRGWEIDDGRLHH